MADSRKRAAAAARKTMPFPDTATERKGLAAWFAFVRDSLGSGPVVPIAWLASMPLFGLLALILTNPFWIGALTLLASLIPPSIAALALLSLSRPCAKEAFPSRYVLAKKAMGYVMVAAFIVDCVFMTSSLAAGTLSEGAYVALACAMAVRAAANAALFYSLSRKPLKRALGLYSLRGSRERYEPPFKRTPLFHVLDTLDALVQAALIVIFVNAFFFQIYVIPSESMVPSYLVGDRTIVARIGAGAKIPLTTIKLPGLKAPARGDIAVVQNPRYEHSAATAISDFANNIVFMLTFSAVNPNGNTPDPLVKRIVGVPGDRLCMVDDVVWVLREGGEWQPLAEDAAWRANGPDDFAKVRDKVKSYVIPNGDWAAIERFQASKESMDLSKAGDTLRSRAKELEALAVRLAPTIAAMPIDLLRAPFTGIARTRAENSFADVPNISGSWAAAALVKASGDPEYARTLGAWLTQWLELPEPSNPYAASTRRENVLLKLLASEYLLKVANGVDSGLPLADALVAAQAESNELGSYCSSYLGMLVHTKRNFPPFPEGEFIPFGKYFMMGDNRYNSIDCRHKSEGMLYETALDGPDAFSPMIYASFDPMYIDAGDIMGYPALTIWPLDRFRAF